MKTRFLLIVAAVAVLSASCQKEEIQTDPQIDAPESEAVAGKLISATKTSSVPATDYLEKFIGSEQSKEKTVELLRLQLLGMDLIHFDIVTYRIHYWSTTIVNGEPRYIKLAGDVSYIADSSGFSRTRHLESVSMVHTMYNTAACDTEKWEVYGFKFRSIYNALVIYPFYQGGPDSELPDAEGCEGKYVLTSEFIIKAKQAIDCELAALEFIDRQEGVEMMPEYYTENIGISNGGGPALAFQYVLENDAAYTGFGDQINLRSTYVGAGNCSNESLVDNLHKVCETSRVAELAPGGYITTVAGAYMTWGDKYFSDCELENYFSPVLYETAFVDSVWTHIGEPCNDNPLNVYLKNTMSLMNDCQGLSLPNTANDSILDGDKKLIKNIYTDKLLAAFKENDKISSGWTPQADLRIVHSDSDDFLPYDTNYLMWKNLSHYGFLRHIRMETQEDLTHAESTGQCVLDILLNKHPYDIIISIPSDFIMNLVGQSELF